MNMNDRTFLRMILLLFVFAVSAVPILSQKRFVVKPPEAEGAYWLVSPKPWFTRQLTISDGNRELAKDSHDESLPTLPGYYHRTTEGDEFTRFPFKSVQVRGHKAQFTTKTVAGIRWEFQGRYGTEYDKSSMIDDVPFLRGTLLKYRRGKLVKRERVKFGHAVNA